MLQLIQLITCKQRKRHNHDTTRDGRNDMVSNKEKEHGQYKIHLKL